MKLRKQQVFMIIAGAVGFLLLASFVLVSINTFSSQDEDLNVRVPEGAQPALADTLDLVTWNVGYAGLGAESDFIIDGGTHLLPPSRHHTEANLVGIQGWLAGRLSSGTKIFLLQETAQASSITYGIDVYGTIGETLGTLSRCYSPSAQVRWFPVVGTLFTGSSIFSSPPPLGARRYALPVDQGPISGVFTLKYNFIAARYPIAGSSHEWVIINLHFAAFDKGGELRKKQLAKLKGFVEGEYVKGNYVVVGGDWNHRLTSTSFPYDTEEKYLFWIHDLPAEFTPSGWTWGVDSRSPTVRTVERPYRPGGSYTCVVDGFLVSPNVEILGTTTFDLGFRNSDHNPVSIKVKRKE